MDESGETPVPRLKQKVIQVTHSRNKDQKQTKKKKKYKTRYSKEWEKTYPFLKACSTHVFEKEYKFHCSCCNSNLLFAQGGINDVAKHTSKELRLIST